MNILLKTQIAYKMQNIHPYVSILNIIKIIKLEKIDSFNPDKNIKDEQEIIKIINDRVFSIES